MIKAYLALNRQMKLALFVAPVLLILGWALSDIWLESQAMKQRIYKMQLLGEQCDLVSKDCVLSTGDFQVSVYVEDATTKLNSTFPLDTATVFIVTDKQSQTFPMAMSKSPYHWSRVTALNTEFGSAERNLRLIVTVKGGQYFAELKNVIAR